MTEFLIILSLIGADFSESIPLEEGVERGVIEIDLSGCKYRVKRGESNSILSVFISYDEDRILPKLECERREEVCRLKVSTEEKENTFLEEDSAVVYLTPDLPLSLRILTSSDTKIDLSGLKIDDLDIILGPGITSLKIKEPNSIKCKSARIFGNIGKLTSEDLGNLNFDNIYIDINAGMASLDLTGCYQERSNVEIRAGITILNLVLPCNTGIRLKTNGIIYSTIEGLIREDNWYTSPDFGKTEGELIIHVQGGFSKLNVRYGDDKTGSI